MTEWKDIWQRLAEGKHAVLLGAERWIPPDAGMLRAIVVDCDLTAGPGSALEQARRRVESLVNEQPQGLLGSALAHARWKVRRRLLNEPAGALEADIYRETLSRAAGTDPPTALVFRSVDKADPVSLQRLRALFADRLGVPLPILLCFDAAPEAGEPRALWETLTRLGLQAVIPTGSGAPTRAPAARPLLEALPDKTIAVLRAAATLGPGFESEVVAAMLGQRELEVLAELQRAQDRGVPLEDRGEGRFWLQEDLVQELRAHTLPSLTRAWHAALADLFGGLPALEQIRDEQPAPSLPSGSATQSTPAFESGKQGGDHRDLLQPEQIFDVTTEGAPELVDNEQDWARALSELAEKPPSPENAPAARHPSLGPHRTSEGVDELRAASHAAAAGDLQRAVENYLRGAERAASAGTHELALKYAELAHKHLTQLPTGEQTRLLRTATLLLMARSRWLSVGQGNSTTLEAALEPLEAARTALANGADGAWLSQFASLYASICYDIGSPEALERALRELTQAGKRLLQLKQPLLAAELLNDEAAVWVRIGDPVRAHHLLSRSREVFGRVVSTHPTAARELAETEHLLARLMLSAPARPGKQRDALRLGIEHALSAEEGYLSLGDKRQLARVWETLGRLQAALENLERAAHYLSQARNTQVQLGDGMGLARSSAALAQVFAQLGDHERALQQLGESVHLNIQKGSVAGLAFNLEALRQLKPAWPAELRHRAESLEAKIEELSGPVQA